MPRMLSWAMGLLMGAAWASDPVPLIKDARARGELLNRQIQAINQRTNLANQSCSSMLADLPGADGEMIPFSQAVTAIEKTQLSIHRHYPAACIRQLLQNLALEDESSTLNRVMAFLADLRPQYEGAWGETLACTPQASSSSVQGLLQMLEDTQSVTNCSPLQEGQWRRVSHTSPYGSRMRYSMLRQDGQVRIALNVEFQERSYDSEDGLNARVSPAAMMHRVRGCLQATQGLIRNADGEPLVFDLLTPAEVDNLPAHFRPDKSTITIDRTKEFRSNSTNYSAVANCPTLVHEVMHLLGLCDEYPGESDGKLCRSVPGENTMMNETFEAFNVSVPRQVSCQCVSPSCRLAITQPARLAYLRAPRSFERTSARFRNAYCGQSTFHSSRSWPAGMAQAPVASFAANVSNDGLLLTMQDSFLAGETADTLNIQEVVCRCPADDQACRQTLQEIRAGTGYANLSECPSGSYRTRFVWGGSGTTAAQVSGDTFSYSVTPSRRPLLHPTHVRHIMAGGCEQGMQSYNRCAANAYADSASDCSDTPDYCRKPDYLDR